MQIHDSHTASFFRKFQGDRSPHALSTTGHHRDFIFEQHVRPPDVWNTVKSEI
jgi:hypothetical protein